jgi:hypothetical protein
MLADLNCASRPGTLDSMGTPKQQGGTAEPVTILVTNISAHW